MMKPDAVLVLDETGSLASRYLHGPAVDQLFADEDVLGEVLWLLGDHQNSVRDVVEYNAVTGTSSVVNHLQYSSFGEITGQTAPSKQPLLSWTGRYRDPDTGLQYNWHRWYDPAIGRWISKDPIGFAGQDANLYRYVGNGPTNFIDPTGLFRSKSNKHKDPLSQVTPNPPRVHLIGCAAIPCHQGFQKRLWNPPAMGIHS